MYLSRFIQSLDMLRKPEHIDTSTYPSFPAEEIIYFGYEETTDDNGTPRCLLYYCIKANPAKIETVDVSDRWDYMKALDREEIDLENGIAQEDVKVAFLEGLWLFDAVSTADVPLVCLDANNGIGTVYAVATHSNPEDEALLPVYENNVFRRDLAFAQARYFVKQYVKSSLWYNKEKATKNTAEMFEAALKEAVTEFFPDKSTCDLKSTEVTGRLNTELDDLIEQLEYMPGRMLSDAEKEATPLPCDPLQEDNII